jgi:hypothetical protein
MVMNGDKTFRALSVHRPDKRTRLSGLVPALPAILSINANRRDPAAPVCR